MGPRHTLVAVLFVVALIAPGARAQERAGAARACAVSTAFPTPDESRTWLRAGSARTAALPGGPRHRAQDVVASEDGPVQVVGRFAYGLVDAALEGERYSLYVQLAAPCGPWRRVASGLTSRRGEHGTRWGLRDEGGRAFVELHASQRPPVGAHPARFLVHGDGSHADFVLYVLAPRTSVVVFDIDGTLSTEDGELFRQLFGAVVGRPHEPLSRPGAQRVVARWVERGYLPVYLTGRPDPLAGASRAWLRRLGFPPGPLRTSQGGAESLPTEEGVARYKADFLMRLRLQAGLWLAAAYGNATTDITAYENAGVPKSTTWIVGQHAGERGTRAVVDYRICAEELRSLSPASPLAPPGRW